MKAKELLEKFLRFAAEDENLPVLELSAGVEKEVECGRSGRFTDRHGTSVVFDKANLIELAGTLDPEEALVKIGHTPINTDTPHYGSVKALRYDARADRLLATIVPTAALVEKNRKEGFRRVSMELAMRSKKGPFSFLHLAVLAACKPGISGLTPVEFAAKEGDSIFVLAGDAEEEAEGAPPMTVQLEALDKAAKVASKSSEQEKTKMEPTAELAALKEKSEKQEAELARMRKQSLDGRRAHVKAKLTELAKKIPMTGRQTGLEEFLVAQLGAESGADQTLEFSVPDGKDKTKTVKQAPSEFIFAFLAALPDLISAAEGDETTSERDAAHEDAPLEMAEGVTKESQGLDFSARKLIKEAKANGEDIDYLEAVRRIERKSVSK